MSPARREMAAEEVDRLLREQRIVRVAFHAEGRGYLVPLGYLWMEGALHLLTAPGEKTRLAAANPRVAFQVDDASGSLLSWTSVTGEGAWEEVEDEGLRRRVLEGLLERFPELADWGRGKGTGGGMRVVRVTPDWMTGRSFRPDP